MRRQAMKNRDRYILKVNEYDMLMNMQKNIQNCYSCCALDVITGKMINCPEEMKGKVGEQSRLAVCSKCIQKWLNEEE
jgi:hypothetical protein